MAWIERNICHYREHVLMPLWNIEAYHNDLNFEQNVSSPSERHMHVNDIHLQQLLEIEV